MIPLDDVLRLTRAGLRAFPLRGKLPAIRGGRGHLDATQDPEVLTSWRHLFEAPRGAAGVWAEDVLVLDVDPRSGGDDALGALLEQHEPLPRTWAARTGGGGWHYYFRAPTGMQWGKTLTDGVDLKSAGIGYVVAPPSTFEARTYAWEVSPWDCDLADLPEWAYRYALKRTRTGRVAGPARERPPATGAAADSVVALGLAFAGHEVTGIDSDRVAVACPWEREHTTSSPTGTVVFAPTAGRPLGKFWCSHSHCEGRGTDEVLEALPSEAVSWAVSEAARRLGGHPEDDPEERAAIMWEGAA